MARVTITLIGGPTALIEAGGFRFLTDPTFDPPGGNYAMPRVILRKTVGPALSADAVGPIDVVLLSHDQHADNLDHAGRAFLPKAGRVLTTMAGAERLGGRVKGLAPWATARVTNEAGQSVLITATPARHGPAGIEPISGEVTGFVLSFGDGPTRPVYVTGDTVWFEGVAEVARRFRPGIVIPFAGASQPIGPFDLTMDTNDTVEAAHRFGDAVIVPIHTDSWAHFMQGREDLRKAFAALGLAPRLVLLEPGVATAIEPPE
jgi:L-ascorbate metabolism protein UlaG (beta-lactamase superfamily)